MSPLLCKSFIIHCRHNWDFKVKLQMSPWFYKTYSSQNQSNLTLIGVIRAFLQHLLHDSIKSQQFPLVTSVLELQSDNKSSRLIAQQAQAASQFADVINTTCLNDRLRLSLTFLVFAEGHATNRKGLPAAQYSTHASLMKVGVKNH